MNPKVQAKLLSKRLNVKVVGGGKCVCVCMGCTLRNCLQPNFTFICHPAAGPTVHQDRLFLAYFPIFSTVSLELAATYSSDQQLCLFLNPHLKLFLFTQAFTEH